MFAVIENGGRQHMVEEGQLLSIDYRSELNDGDTVTFDKVLAANSGADSAIGQPVINGASVTAEVIMAMEKGPKLEIQKIRRRKNSRRHTGHRQKYTAVKITSIDVPGMAKPAPAPEAPAKEQAPAAEETSTGGDE